MCTPRNITLAFLLISVGCVAPPGESPAYQEIAAELLAMEEVDQEFNYLHATGAPRSKEEGFMERKKQMYIDNTSRVKEIFEEIGYPLASDLGSEGAEAFWIIVQHSDSDPKFQERVAIAMKPVVQQGEASGANFAYLTDRFHVNTGRLQLYGTQAQYDMASGKAFPKELEDPRGVDARRAEVGLDPLWQYMNELSELHFTWNEDHYEEVGVVGPWTYPEGFLEWE